jgi:lysophospholipase
MSSSTRAGLAAQQPPAHWLSDEGGGRLAFSAYPAADPKLHLLISHGFGEHRGWYDHVAAAFRDEGISAYTFDHFHHGSSSGRPADAPRYEVLTHGLRLALEQGVEPHRTQGAPLALLGHSNGGLAVLRALDELPPGTVSAVVLSNPLLALPPRFSVWGYAAARLLAHIAPGLKLPVRNLPWRLTGDRTVWPDYARDPFRFRSVSVRFFLEMMHAARQARRGANCHDSPLLLLLSGKDRVVDSAATLAWFEGLDCPAKRLIPYPGLRHEIFNERPWRTVAGEVAMWLKAQAPPSARASRNEETRARAPEGKGHGLS